jgi:hypothetical protein
VSSMKLFIVLLLVVAMPAAAQSPGTPAPATNQCWDTARAELRDKTSATTTRKTGETNVGQDQSPGNPAPPSGNAAGSGQPKSPNAIRPQGVTDC